MTFAERPERGCFLRKLPWGPPCATTLIEVLSFRSQPVPRLQWLCAASPLMRSPLPASANPALVPRAARHSAACSVSLRIARWAVTSHEGDCKAQGQRITGWPGIAPSPSTPLPREYGPAEDGKQTPAPADTCPRGSQQHDSQEPDVHQPMSDELVCAPDGMSLGRERSEAPSPATPGRASKTRASRNRTRAA